MMTAVSGSRVAVGRKVLAALGLVMCAAPALAQQPGCIELRTTAEIEQEYVNEQGRKDKLWL